MRRTLAQIIRPRRLIDRWHRYICGAAIAALAIFGARAPAKADTTFTYSCFSLDGGSSLCPTSLPLTATITFPGTAPLDETNETLFTGPAILTENTPGLSGSVQLPSNLEYFIAPNSQPSLVTSPGGELISSSLVFVNPSVPSPIINQLAVINGTGGQSVATLVVAGPSGGGLVDMEVGGTTGSPVSFSGLFINPSSTPPSPQIVYLDFGPGLGTFTSGRTLFHTRSLILASTAISRQSRPTCRIYMLPITFSL